MRIGRNTEFTAAGSLGGREYELLQVQCSRGVPTMTARALPLRNERIRLPEVDHTTLAQWLFELLNKGVSAAWIAELDRRAKRLPLTANCQAR